MPLAWFILVALVVYVGLTLTVALKQPRYVYVPSREVRQDPSDLNIPFEAVDLMVEGEVVKAWYVEGAGADDAGRPVILFCHGNGGNLGDRLNFVRTFHEMAVNFLIFDYRGYGESDGVPTEAGTYQDAMAAWNYLVDTRQVNPLRIIVHGRSLGGAVATWLTVHAKPAGLVLESTFGSARQMAADMFPILPVRWFCRFDYDSLGRMPSVECPVLIAHAHEDSVVPYHHGRMLFEATRAPREFVVLVGGHNESGIDTNPQFHEAYRAFIDRCVSAR